MTYTVDEVAQKLGISRGAAYEAAKSGEIPAIRIGRRIVCPKRRIDALLEGGAPVKAGE
jgi:excisionase family DNA binding protein